MALPTPAPDGTITRSIPIFSASRVACTGPPPPKAMSVRPSKVLPDSMACTRAALAMFSSTISTMPSAAISGSNSSSRPTPAVSAERAAPSAAFDHFDHRDPQRQPRPLLEAADASHLAAPRRLGTELIDQADLCGGAAHIEGNHMSKRAFSRHLSRKDRATCRPALDHSDRKAAGRLHGGEPAAGEHQEDGRSKAHPTQLRLKSPQVAPHERLPVGVS